MAWTRDPTVRYIAKVLKSLVIPSVSVSTNKLKAASVSVREPSYKSEPPFCVFRVQPCKIMGWHICLNVTKLALEDRSVKAPCYEAPTFPGKCTPCQCKISTGIPTRGD